MKKGLGELYIQDKPFVSIKESENDIYCRFSKDKQTDPITYEVVSHYFNQSVSKKIEEKLLKFGLNLRGNENYSKEIILNSESDINNTVLEIANIFEPVFNLSDSQEYYFHEGIVDNRPAHYVIQQHSINKFHEGFNQPNGTIIIRSLKL